MKSVVCFSLFLVSVQFSFGQENKGSSILENSFVQIEPEGVRSLYGETIYFGPQAEWTIDGTLEIWCQRIWISPEAKIQGNGRLLIHNPAENPYYNGLKKKPTVIDGNNGNFIKLLVEHHNTAGILLDNIDDPGYRTVDPSGAEAAALNFGSELKLAQDGADIQLNGYNLSFDANALLSQYSHRRKLIVGTDYGHVSKILTAGSQFVFPIATARQLYSPVTVSENDIEGTVVARVSDSFNSQMRLKSPQSGIDVNWQVYSMQSLNATLTLQHPSTANKEKYTDEKAAIYQFTTMEEADRLPTKRVEEGIHRSGAVSLANQASDYRSWFTKSIALSSELFIPNVFTPNGDGVNDRFEIRGIEAFDHVSITIYNRWGNSIYEHANYDNSWNGTGLNAGTYYYVIETKEGPLSSIHKGWVLLIKEN